jgi:membrane protein YqaA with SNARE-associated domain
LYDGWRAFAGSRAAVILVFAWAMGEATVFPILADFLLVALLIVIPARRWMLLGACLAGMALGGIVTVLVAHSAPGFALDVLHELPLVTESHIRRADRLLVEHGIAGFVLQPLSGIPFKVWAVVAGQQALTPWLVIPAFIAARSARMALIGVGAWLLGRGFARPLRDWFVLVTVAYVLVFAAGFAVVVL